MIGKTVSHYKIIESLGQGGMGVVYKAEDTKLKRTVALKFLSAQAMGVEEDKTRLIHEAQAAAALNHPNICTVFEIDEVEGQTFIVMEYIKESSLKKKIESGPLNFRKALDISLQVADGLQEAHEKGIIHRDIKSANVMINEKGQAKIMDFGLAKLAGRTKVTKTGMTMGTVAYMSPEQSRGLEVDQRTDIWSFGVMVCEMITGQPPFGGDYEQAVLYSILNEEQEPMTGLRTGVPMDLERIINKCLSKSSEERYQHADELAADLHKLLRELDLSEKIPSTKVKIQKSSKRKIKKKSLYIGILLSVVILIIATILLSNYIFKPFGSKTEISSIAGWENSIAVLPFDNISADPEQEYFCDGMTEQIISNLAKLSRLKVISRTSVMKYKSTNKTIPEIGKELNVAHILEGSVRKFGNRIRVTAQLISTKDDFHLWTESYDKEYKELFELQDVVSESIAANLLTKLSGEERLAIKSNGPNNIQAYEYYLKGRHFIYVEAVEAVNSGRSSGEEQLKIAEELLKKAIKLDPDFADSYASLADVYNTYYNWFAISDGEKDKYWHLQEVYLDTALKLNPNSAEAHFVRHFLHHSKANEYYAAGDYEKFGHEFDELYKCLKKAIISNKNHSYAYWRLSYFFRGRGLINLAIKYSNKSIELNPLHYPFYSERGYCYYFIGEYDHAEADYQKIFQSLPNNFWNLRAYTKLLIVLNRYEEAENMLLKLENIKSDWPAYKSLRAMLYLLRGEKNNVIEGDFSKHDRFTSDLILKKREAVLLYMNNDLERVKTLKGSHYLLLKKDTSFDFLRSDPRFEKILVQHKELYEESLRKYGDIDI
jgi:serine/threonine protein kinase/Tfp pilus assembly protein PilF